MENSCTNQLIISVKLVFSEIERMVCEQPFDEYTTKIKEDGTIVSTIDIELQSKIINTILAHFPKHNFLCEETTGINTRNTESKYFWVIDPIDGTKNFVDGKDEYSISVGLMENTKFIAALVIFPKLKETYQAIKDEGITCNNQPFVFKKGRDTSEVILCSKTFPKYSKMLESKGYKATCYYCATYSILRLLKNKGVFYHTINTQLYDVGPMSFILSQAGFRILNSSYQSLEYLNEIQEIPFFLATSCKKKTSSIISLIY